MRRIAASTTVLLATAGTLLTGAGAAQADVWHFVAHYGTNWTACNDRGSSDVRNGYAGRYDCRTVSTFPAKYDLWES
jgi:hypothetical protein